MPTLLEAENLEAQYGSTKVLHGLGFAGAIDLNHPRRHRAADRLPDECGSETSG